MITYQFNNSLQVLEVYYEGIVTFSDVMDYGEMIYNDDSLPRDLKILTDARAADYHIEPGDVPKVMEGIERNLEVYESITNAMVQKNPKETAYSYMLRSKVSSARYRHSVFSTKKAAIDWLIFYER